MLNNSRCVWGIRAPLTLKYVSVPDCLKRKVATLYLLSIKVTCIVHILFLKIHKFKIINIYCLPVYNNLSSCFHFFLVLWIQRNRVPDDEGLDRNLVGYYSACGCVCGRQCFCQTLHPFHRRNIRIVDLVAVYIWELAEIVPGMQKLFRIVF